MRGFKHKITPKYKQGINPCLDWAKKKRGFRLQISRYKHIGLDQVHLTRYLSVALLQLKDLGNHQQ